VRNRLDRSDWRLIGKAQEEMGRGLIDFNAGFYATLILLPLTNLRDLYRGALAASTVKTRRFRNYWRVGGGGKKTPDQYSELAVLED
jgi:hypothetical protein